MSVPETERVFGGLTVQKLQKRSLNYDSYSYSYCKTHRSSLEMVLFGAVVAKCFFFIRGFLFNKIYLFSKISQKETHEFL